MATPLTLAKAYARKNTAAREEKREKGKEKERERRIGQNQADPPPRRTFDQVENYKEGLEAAGEDGGKPWWKGSNSGW
jgi:hypothetical protein